MRSSAKTATPHATSSTNPRRLSVQSMVFNNGEALPRSMMSSPKQPSATANSKGTYPGPGSASEPVGNTRFSHATANATNISTAPDSQSLRRPRGAATAAGCGAFVISSRRLYRRL